MDLTKEENDRSGLKEILVNLSESQDIFRDENSKDQIYSRLEQLYYKPQKVEAFHLFQSDIFYVLTVDLGDKPDSIDILGQNLEQIRKNYEPKNRDSDGQLIDISGEIRELCDSVSLHIAQMRYSDAADRIVSQESTLEEVRRQVSSVNLDLKAMWDTIKEQKKTAKIWRVCRRNILRFWESLRQLFWLLLGGSLFQLLCFKICTVSVSIGSLSLL